MAYFDQEFINFFEDLSANNSKEWFDENRKRYEKAVKKPFAAFTDEMIGRINGEDPEVRIQAKDAITRINRDIRFSPDKTPYNIHVGAVISSVGRRDKTVPGIFYRFRSDGIDIFGGVYGADKNQLHRLRSTIAEDPEGFMKLINESKFARVFGEIKGEKNKRIPKEFQEVAKQYPIIANKGFYYVAQLDQSSICAEDLAKTLMDHWKIAQPVKDYLHRAMN